MEYAAPLVAISSIALLLLFKDINIKNIKVHNIICYISSLTFGVYLIECSYIQDVWHYKFFKVQNY